MEDCQIVEAAADDGLRPVAIVTLRDGATLEEAVLPQFCREAPRRLKVPVRIFAVDAFPTATSANGTKVQLAKLREIAQAGLST